MSHTIGNALLLTTVGRQSGVTIVPSGSRLTRLHYYDGKFLRAAHLDLEQRYVQSLVQLSNQAGGPGVVHGFSIGLGSGDTLEVSEGLAIDPQGRVLTVPSPSLIEIPELLGASRNAAPVPPRDIGIRPVAPMVETMRAASTGVAAHISHLPTSALTAVLPPRPVSTSGGSGAFADCVPRTDDPGRVFQSTDLYLIVIAHAEALCGQEDVYGRLCEAACTTTTERPYYIEGIVVRAIPLDLVVTLGQIGPIILGLRHLRSRVASAYFAREAGLIGSLISKAGLNSDTWCLGAEALGGFGVPIGVLGRAGETTTFLDAWIGRRERMDAPPRKYWAWRMAMRPWDVFLAHVLQFQCHLHELFIDTPGPGKTDPCRESRGLIDEASGALTSLKTYYEKVTGALAGMTGAVRGELTALDLVKDRLGSFGHLLERLDDAKRGAGLGDRVLIRGGIVELPSAGYLPIARPSELSVNAQVRNLLGEGVDLRFCVVRPDFVPHALEEAQHMERISLVQGLATPLDRPKVDILVPNGEPLDLAAKMNGMGFAGDVRFQMILAGSPTVAVAGVGRGEISSEVGAAFHFAGMAKAPTAAEFNVLANGFGTIAAARAEAGTRVLEGPATPVPADLRRLREATRLVAPARLAALDAGRGLSGSPAGIPTNVLAAAAARKAAAVWATLRSQTNPFALQLGQEAWLTGRLIVVIPTADVSLIDVKVSGPMRVTDLTPSPTATDRCTGVVALDITWKSLVGAASEEKHWNPESKIILERLDGPSESTVTARVSIRVGERVLRDLVFQTSWSGSPINAKCTGIFEVGQASLANAAKTVPVLNSAFLESPDVLTAGNAQREVAETALDVIDAVLAEPAFKANAEHLLFPAPNSPTREQVLRPMLDWVLFHRRRDKECGVKEAAVDVKNRRYKVYSAVVKEAGQVNTIREALLTNDAVGLQRAKFLPVGVVEFGGNSANLLTSPTALVNQWQNVGHGNRILFGGLANQPDAIADGEALSMQRVKQLELALGPVGMTLDATARAALLPAVPVPTLPADDTDGVIAIVSFKFVDVRRARVLLYTRIRPDVFRPRGTHGDITVLFHDHVLVEDTAATTLLSQVHALTRSAGESAEQLDLVADTLDDNAAKRAKSIADFIRRTEVETPIHVRYRLLQATAPVETRGLTYRLILTSGPWCNSRRRWKTSWCSGTRAEAEDAAK